LLRSVEDISSTKKRLLIEIPAEEIEREMQKAYSLAQAEARIPGFRPGKVPIGLIVKRFGDAILAEVLERIVPEAYKQSIKESGLVPVSPPELEEEIEYKKNSPITMKVRLDVRPEVEPLNYKGIEIEEVPVVVTEEDVQRVLEAVANDKANYEIAEDEVREGDLVTFDCYSQSGQKRDVVIKVGPLSPFPEDFNRAFVGKTVNDTFEVEADFTDRSDLQLNGLKGTLSITITSVKRLVAPPIDDEFAKDVGFENMEKLRERTREILRITRTNEANNEKIGQILERLDETHDFELPESLLENELVSLIDEYKATEKETRSEEELRRELLPLAKKNVKIWILLDLIGKQEGIEVTKEEVERELYSTASQFNVAPEDLLRYYMEKDGSLIRIHNRVYTKSVFKRLLDCAVIKNSDNLISEDLQKEAQ